MDLSGHQVQGVMGAVLVFTIALTHVAPVLAVDARPRLVLDACEQPRLAVKASNFSQ